MTKVNYFDEAAHEACKARCTRARCGAVVVRNGNVIGHGYNAPPGDSEAARMCHTDFRTSRKPKSDRTCCVHAEWRALFDAVRRDGDITGADLYFVRVDEEGAKLPSGEPYCTVCSRLALDLGLAHFWLLHTDGPHAYPTLEYNALSYRYHENKEP